MDTEDANYEEKKNHGARERGKTEKRFIKITRNECNQQKLSVFSTIVLVTFDFIFCDFWYSELTQPS